MFVSSTSVMTVSVSAIHGDTWNLELAQDWTEALDAVSEHSLVAGAPEDHPV